MRSFAEASVRPPNHAEDGRPEVVRPGADLRLRPDADARAARCAPGLAGGGASLWKRRLGGGPARARGATAIEGGSTWGIQSAKRGALAWVLGS